ncbi:SDR family oxidoreductase [Rhizobium rosettiformans]|uniref:SDR family oxidoreductase n=1 Tax=Rhizobium rosettiformans TaxID=1368430 RepID=UPI0028657B7B|nr:SDR family oxidoreductase [Rhizobium rosettiformans]MDR7030197.1 NAD(P)-dependent dehydrogenase (short-subunit alcohol dehydrogenase family) [Rhizobium rosettiformans]MDR7065822.1 NAD(P)-dependent dehydrogenase (short-subunit alcohol dehydrogenase family) [Rhizobium rosettiformans]
MSAFSGMTSLNPGYRALVLGASGGIGGAFAAAIKADPACGSVTELSRSRDGFDITDDAAVGSAAARLSDAGLKFDLILCATGALVINGNGPEKTIKAIQGDVMAAQFALNAIGPALALKHFAPLLSSEGKSVFATLSARVGSIGDNKLGGWISYRSAKSALNQITRTSAIEIARLRPKSVVVAMHPGTVDTGFSGGFSKGHDRIQPAESVAMMLSVLDRLEPAQTGGFFAYDGQPIEW